MSSYAGFPNAINAMLTLKEVVADRKLEGKQDQQGIVQPASIPKDSSRYELGAKLLTRLNPKQVENLEQTFKDISPDMARFVIEYGIADILSRPALDLKQREMATMAALTAMGSATSQLKFHIEAGLNIGITDVEIGEIMILMSVYCGFPAAINGTLALKEVMKERAEN